MTLAAADWRTVLPAGALVLAVLAAIVYWIARRPADPDEIERKRRAYLNQVGRICEGQVVEIVERNDPSAEASAARGKSRKQLSPKSGRGRKLVCYTYLISGVTYETAQDITGLEQHIHFQRLAAGQPASVKYDPSNPTNSILIADDWSGLR